MSAPSTYVRVYAAFPQSFGAFAPGPFDPGTFDTSEGGSILVYGGVHYRVRVIGSNMPDRFFIKRHDNRPDLIMELLSPNGTVVDLTNVSTVRLLAHGRAADSPPATILDVAMTVLDAPLGLVRHVWSAAQTAKHGVFQAEVEVTWLDGTKQTYPNGGYFTIEIGEDLNPMPAVPEDLQFVWNEVPAGVKDGSNAVFTLAHAPDPISSLRLLKNGQELLAGVGYSLSGATITYATVPIDYRPQNSDDLHWVHYVWDAAA